MLTPSVEFPEPKRMVDRVEMKNRFIKFEHEFRWVPTAPLGRPVVPEV